MLVDVLVCEIGSTTTVVNAFDLKSLKFLGRGVYKTTVDTDVSIGVQKAIEDLAANLNVKNVEYKEMYATSSAAGGLKMTVHGLVYDMTVTAAFEAALGAGANIVSITSGKMRPIEVRKLESNRPNIILLSGGVDYGESDTVIYNAELIANLKLNVPVIYAGNIQCHDDIEYIFEEAGQKEYLKIAANVYPKIDELNVEETRAIIHDTFEEHIIHAKGMNKIFDYVTKNVIPTPGAVLKMSEILYEEYEDLLCFDIGGATTDLHSVTEGSDEFNKVLINPQPKSKRTVEGDLGVYVNKDKVVEYIGIELLAEKLKLSIEETEKLIANYHVIPTCEKEYQLVSELAKQCVKSALDRHAGSLTNLYTTSGAKVAAEGKDLTAVKTIICTGGVLTNFENRAEIIKSIYELNNSKKMYPGEGVRILYDSQYVMASLGVLSMVYPDKALEIMKRSLKEE